MIIKDEKVPTSCKTCRMKCKRFEFTDKADYPWQVERCIWTGKEVDNNSKKRPSDCPVRPERK